MPLQSGEASCSTALQLLGEARRRRRSAPISRFSRTDMSGKTLASCGTMLMPSLVIACGPQADQVVRCARADRERRPRRRAAAQAIDRLEQGRFAGAVRTDHRDDRAARHVDRDAVQHVFVDVAG